MNASIGRIVHYRLEESDAFLIETRRARTYSVEWAGNPAKHGDVFPAIVTAVFDDNLVNLKVFLDGPDDFWVGSVSEGEKEGQWFWPPRV